MTAHDREEAVTLQDAIEDAITLLEAAPAHRWGPNEPDETIGNLRAALARYLAPDTLDVETLRALSDAASPGPWTAPERERIAWIIRERAGGAQVANTICEEDAAFIVAAVNYVRTRLRSRE